MHEIEEISRRFDSFHRTPGGTLDGLRVKAYRQEAEMIELRRQVELGSAPSPPLNQQAGNDRLPIPTNSGDVASCLHFKTFLHMSSIVPVRRRAKPQPSHHYDMGQLA